ncbi:MAG: response regulator [Deltaproteobacteria bacterium]|nr:response regulator [Deltaproteobacteria bacterium]
MVKQTAVTEQQCPEKVNILLVDDRWENLVSLKAALDAPGYNLVKASSGREALAELLGMDFALILLDVQMPILNGFETAALIKQREKTRGIPIIFVTGVNTDEPFIFKGYDVGAVDYLIKPFDPSVLRSKVAVFADLYRKTEQIKRQAELLRESDRRKMNFEILCREQALDRKYRELVNGINDGIVWSADKQTLAISFVGPQITPILDVTPERCLVDPDYFWRLMFPYDQAAFTEWVGGPEQKTSEFSCEHRVLGKNDSVLWFKTSVRTSCADMGGKSELRGLSVDITHLKETQFALQKSEERFRLMADVGRIFSESLDIRVRLGMLATLVIPFLGDYCFFDLYTDDGANMQPITWRHSDASEQAVLTQVCEQAKSWNEENGFVSMTAEGPILLSDVTDETLSNTALGPKHLELLRRLKPCSLIAVPLIAHEKLLGVFTLCCGSSGRHYTTEDFKLVQKLAQRASLALENALLYAQAQEAVRIREEFVSIASHELKTPLTSLKMQLQLLSRIARGAVGKPDSELGTKVPQILAGSDRQMSRICKLVDELMDVTRIRSGKLTLDTESLDLSALVTETVQRFTDDLNEVGCALSIDVPTQLYVECDRLRIEQVLSNLLCNAMRYAPRTPIRVALTCDGSRVYLSVKDHGRGISETDQQRIFQRFERGMPDASFGGLGLGLYIVRQILDAHRATIAIKSAPGQGATFVIELPLRQLSTVESLAV